MKIKLFLSFFFVVSSVLAQPLIPLPSSKSVVSLAEEKKKAQEQQDEDRYKMLKYTQEMKLKSELERKKNTNENR